MRRVPVRRRWRQAGRGCTRRRDGGGCSGAGLAAQPGARPRGSRRGGWAGRWPGPSPVFMSIRSTVPYFSNSLTTSCERGTGPGSGVGGGRPRQPDRLDGQDGGASQDGAVHGAVCCKVTRGRVVAARTLSAASYSKLPAHGRGQGEKRGMSSRAVAGVGRVVGVGAAVRPGRTCCSCRGQVANPGGRVAGHHIVLSAAQRRCLTAEDGGLVRHGARCPTRLEQVAAWKCMGMHAAGASQAAEGGAPSSACGLAWQPRTRKLHPRLSTPRIGRVWPEDSP